MKLARYRIFLALALLFAPAPPLHAQAPNAAPVDSGVSQIEEPIAAASQSRRIVAVGDIHGAFDELTSILQEAGLIDKIDRSMDSRARCIYI